MSSESVKCPKCGQDNPPSAKYCPNCGTQLSFPLRPLGDVALRVPVYPGKFAGQAVDHGLARLSPQQQERVDWTRVGIYLIFAGIIFTPIPFIAVYSGIAILAGAVFIFLGRRALGPRHQRYAFRSFLLVTIAQVAAFIGAAFVIILFGRAVSSGAIDLATAFSNLFLTLYVIIVLTDIVTNLALVFFVYDLQDSKGHALLWSAFMLEILVNVIIALVVISAAQATAQQVLSQVTTVLDPFIQLQLQFAAWRLLLWIPAIPYAIAYYRARSRVDKKVVEAETNFPIKT